MRTRSLRLIAIACLVAMAAAPAFAADITGQWTSVIDTMVGPLPWSFTFKNEGGKPAGTATDSSGKEVKLESMKVEGDSISFVENRDVEGLGPTLFSYTGKIVSADEIRFHRVVGSVAEEDFVAKRAK